MIIPARLSPPLYAVVHCCSRPGLAVALAMALAACHGGAAADDAKPDAAGGHDALPAVSVQTAPVARTTLPVTISATGTLASRPGSFVTLSAPSPARITQVYVAVGDPVRAGQPLVTLDQTAFRASAQQAQAARQAAQQAYDRANTLAGQGIVPRRDVETARAALAQADATLVTARRALELATLRSPIAGVVARMTATRDATADPAQPLVQVVDPSALEVRLLLTPTDAARVRPGAPVSVTAGSAATGEVLGTGAVVAVGATVDSASGGVEARARIVHPQRALRLGEVVRATIQAGTRTDALVVPAAALVPNAAGDGYQVFVVGRGDTVHAHPVRLGIRTAQLAQLVEGVAADDVVVADGAYGVDDGVRVAPRTAAPQPAAVRPAAPTRAGARP